MAETRDYMAVGVGGEALFVNESAPPDTIEHMIVGIGGALVLNQTVEEAAGGGTTPKGVFGLPLHGPFGGPI